MSGGLLDVYRDVVRPEWIDHNGHFNMGYYVVVFDYATDAFLDHVGLPEADMARSGVTTFTLEAHVLYLRELYERDPIRITTRVLGFDAKRIHYFHEMYHADSGYLAATNELMSLHVSTETRRGAPMAPEVSARLAEMLRRQQGLPVPQQAGRRIGLDRNP